METHNGERRRGAVRRGRGGRIMLKKNLTNLLLVYLFFLDDLPNCFKKIFFIILLFIYGICYFILPARPFFYPAILFEPSVPIPTNFYKISKFLSFSNKYFYKYSPYFE